MARSQLIQEIIQTQMKSQVWAMKVRTLQPYSLPL
jgi:hypothetical protein